MITGNMIIDSLWVFLFGMLGIFFVMIIIMVVLILLHRFSKGSTEDESD